MANDSKIQLLDAYGNPLQSQRPARGSGLPRYVNSGLSNGAASLTDPSFSTWSWGGGSPDDDLITNLDVVRQRSRDLALNAPVVAGLIKTLVTNTVGIGLIPEPTPDVEYLGMDNDDAAKWKRDILRVWNKFAESKSCDVCGQNNFYELTQLAFRAQIESGDVFVTLPYGDTRRDAPIDLKIQLIEADCVCNPYNTTAYTHEDAKGDIYGGVEVGEHGNILAYWVATRHPLTRRLPVMWHGHWPRRREWIRVPVWGEHSNRRNILHLMQALRPNQRRGVSALAPMVKAIKQLDRYMNAEIEAALVQSLFTMAIYTDNPADMAGEIDMAAALSPNLGALPMSSQAFYEQNGMARLGAGNITFLAPGNKTEAIAATRPYSGFEPFTSAMIKYVGASVGVPFELATMFFQTTYSASKAAMSMFAANVEVQQDYLIYDFCQPIYEAFLAEAVAAGYINAPGFFGNPMQRAAYCRARWSGPAELQIDPGKEVDAAIKRASVGLTTYQQETARIGGDWLANAADRHREQLVYDKSPWDTSFQRVDSSLKNGGQEGDHDDNAGKT